MILDSSILVAFERRRLGLERLLQGHPRPALAAITAAEILIGVERADSPERRALRDSFVQNIPKEVAHFRKLEIKELPPTKAAGG
jgi:tRNA(fMet)-specific endonuclease VapC